MAGSAALCAAMLSDPEAIRSFESEARICGLLSHPLVVGLRGYGSDADGPWMALEYVHSRSASQLVKAMTRAGSTLPMQVALSLCHDTAEGLCCAHRLMVDGQREPLLHRDLSPDNVLVSYTGEARLTDFGIARMMNGTRITRTGLVRGKLGFISPELLEGKQPTEASDVFALAATFFRLLSGVHAFQGTLDVELIRAVQSAQPPKLSVLRPGVPPEVSRWVDAALSKSPSGRPTDLGALLQLLRGAMGCPPVEARKEVARCMDEAFPLNRDPQRAELTRAMRQVEHTRDAPKQRPRFRFSQPLVLGLGALVIASASLTAGLLLAKVTGPAASATSQPEQPHLGEAAVGRPPDEAAGRPFHPDAGAAAVVPEPSPRPEEGATAALPPAAAHPPPRRRTQAPAAQSGTLLVKSDPQVSVFINGRYEGGAPAKVELAPGEHTLMLTHQRLGQHHTRKVTVKAGAVSTVTHRFFSD